MQSEDESAIKSSSSPEKTGVVRVCSVQKTQFLYTESTASVCLWLCRSAAFLVSLLLSHHSHISLHTLSLYLSQFLVYY